MLYFYKILITSVLIVAIAEISKRSSVIAAILASLPLVSILAMLWLYIDTKNIHKVSELSHGVFWLVIPSLSFFLSLPFFLKKNWGFYLSMGSALLVTICCYFIMLMLLKQFGVKL
ncbi:MAG: putative membrane protein (GlpM family) [Francisellaceae bacterium]|jgi:uncharacterized membrane protein (GlpM family)